MRRVVGICVAACIFCIAVLGIAIHQTLNDPKAPFANWRRLDDALEPSKTRGRLIVAQLERFYGERGQYPDQLDELVPEYLSAIPRPTDGEGFFYERRDGEFSLSFGFWLSKNVDLYPRCGYMSAKAEWFVER